MINLNTYFALANLETTVPSWIQGENYFNCESSAISKLLSWFVK